MTSLWLIYAMRITQFRFLPSMQSQHIVHSSIHRLQHIRALTTVISATYKVFDSIFCHKEKFILLLTFSVPINRTSIKKCFTIEVMCGLYNFVTTKHLLHLSLIHI